MRPPAALLQCAVQPQAPVPPLTQRDVAEYLLAVGYAGHDCRSKLAAVKEWAKN